MSLFRRRPVAEAEQRSMIMPTGPWWGPNTHAGQVVGFDSAMRNAAVWACIRVLTGPIVSLPIDVIRVRGDRREQVTPPEVVRSPSGRTSRRVWVGQVVRSLAGAGNAYADIVKWDMTTGRPLQLETIHPNRVEWRSVAGEHVPHVDGVARTTWPRGDLWHLPVAHLTPPGQPFALSPIDAARESIGTGLAAEEFGSRFFGDGGLPPAIIKAGQELNQQQAQAIKDAYKAMVSGRREPAVFGKGLDLEKIEFKPSETQFVDLLQFEVLQACRFWGVPPAMVFAAITGSSITYANIGDADLFFLKHSLSHWLVDLEAAWSEMIVAPQFVKFNVDAFLRMSTTERYAAYATGLSSQFLSVDEVRGLEDLPPFGSPFDRPAGSNPTPTTADQAAPTPPGAAS